MTQGQSMGFKRIAIINRGEPAMRLLRAVKDWNTVRRTCIKTIALYTEPDESALFVREADASFNLGPAMFLDEKDLDEAGKPRRKSRYLDYSALREALVATQADAAWVGWGFVAEHAEFAELCTELGITFLGPTADAMRKLGDKIGSKLLAESAGVPVAPWSGGPVETVEAALTHARHIGFPLVMKATAGGGGRGIRFIHREEELADAFETCSAEARKAFGDGTVFMEALVRAARHVEVQVLADQHGTIWAVGTRDCSAQRNNQKVIEEAPAPIPSAVDQALKEAAVRIARAAGYTSAGTAEFLYDAATGAVFFMEMNTRLQVEHPVTEETTGVDLVQMQMAVAMGEALDPEPPESYGHCIEVRVCAEDPARGFAPAPGKVVCFRPALGPGIRTDSGIREGDQIPVEFDSMIAKIIAYGATREQARARLVRALLESLLVVEGGNTNKAFLLQLLQRPEFMGAAIDTSWIDGLMKKGFTAITGPDAWVALLATAVELHRRQHREEELNFFTSASRGRPVMPPKQRRPIELQFGGATYQFQVSTLEPHFYRVRVDEAQIDFCLTHDGPYECRVACETPEGPRQWRVISVSTGLDHLVEIDGWRYDISRDPGGLMRAPAPGLVLKLHVKEGSLVKAGDRLLALEAMKMEMPVTASIDGRVRKVLVRQGVQVSAGEPLLVMEPLADSTSKPKESVRLPFPSNTAVLSLQNGEADHGKLNRFVQRELRRLLLGFDLGDDALREFLAGLVSDPNAPGPSIDFDIVPRLLVVYMDLESLFSRQYADNASTGAWNSHQQSLYLYLREYRSEGKGLPDDFLWTLRKALKHYGVTSLNPVQALNSALVRIFRSHQNLETKNRVITALIMACLEIPAWRTSARRPGFRRILDMLVALTQQASPAVCEIALQARYQLFEAQDQEQRKAEALVQARDALKRLQEAHSGLGPAFSPELAEERAALMAELTRFPFSLMSYFAPMLIHGDESLMALVMEVMIRRLYRPRPVNDPCAVRTAGRLQLLARCETEEQPLRILATYAELEDAVEALKGLNHLAAQIPTRAEAVVDLFISAPTEPCEESDHQKLAEALAACELDPRLQRVCVMLIHPETSIQYFTFLREGGRWKEIAIQRGFHPAMAERLELWRMRDFEARRIFSSEDLHLFHAKAKQNPRDERFFATAEVRVLHPVRDAEGRITALPEFEYTLLESFHAIRNQQLGRGPKTRLPWNRITIFLWPTLQASRDDIFRIVDNLFPSAQNLGLEKISIHLKLQEDLAEPAVETVMSISDRTGPRHEMTLNNPHSEPLRALDDYTLKLVRARQRRVPYVYEIVKMLSPVEATPELPRGEFEEFDLDPENPDRLVSVKDRPYGENQANVVVGMIRNFTDIHPEGFTRVLVLGDATRELGALAESECRRVIAALDLAEELGLPVEWFPVSSGAKIAMDSGTENLDWTASVLRRIILFTQKGGEINVVVDGINVGAQSYWNAEATMLMHTRGCLIMTPSGSMLLTGKRALDYSGSVSAEDNLGIGGFERIMGPNGQAQYHARDLGDACRILMRHYEHTYRVPGEPCPRRRPTSDPVDRNVCLEAYTGPEAFETFGEIFGEDTNPGRKKPFDIRATLRAIIDKDCEPLERWPVTTDADVAVIWEAHIGGWPACFVGIESKPLPRMGYVPSDGPESWSGGTLFPQASKKIARAINSASGNRPLIVIANLSGFDGSPESMRRLQLEYGAEIGRAIVNFKGPIVFCVVARYHGGAYVVFSKHLNPNLKSLALTGSYASVIGGAPAAAVVFPEEARSLAIQDPRVQKAEKRLKADPTNSRARKDLQTLMSTVLAEKTREVAAQFDAIHTVDRALKVGSLDAIIEPANIRASLVDAIEAGLNCSCQSAR
nr:carboxyl transferase domain-containing protein [uncultured Holophaga sp.]